MGNHKDIKIDVGHVVICDNCGADMTYSSKTGGILTNSGFYCPHCYGETKGSREDNEEYLIEFRCPEHMSFANWVRTMRATRS
jgi:hypothetical protein